MSSEIAIRVKNLSKCYQIYDQPRDRLKQFLLPHIRRVTMRQPKQYFREFWALNDITFDINKGETIGIIGCNGSGKSTLLQIICGTLNPTNGSVTTNGRIAALLELGSGFNPEFTGRENVYMNAALHGLKKNEIDTRFDEITSFADIGDFIEQPIKNYSSGMFVRLAFAVIAHVDADILIIDEALAVGDAIFTQKCMRFLRRFMDHGTVLFVSHDTGSVNNLCSRAIWLDHGKMRMHNTAAEVTRAYSEYCTQAIYGSGINMDLIRGNENITNDNSYPVDLETRISFYEDIANSDGWKTGAAEIKSVLIMQGDGSPTATFSGGESIRLRIEVEAYQSLFSPIIGFFVKDRLGQSLFGEHTYTYVQPPCSVKAGEKIAAEFVFTLPLLPNGEYSMTVSIADGDPNNHVQHHWLHDAVIFRIESLKLRYGLIGIPFKSVTLEKTNA